MQANTISTAEMFCEYERRNAYWAERKIAATYRAKRQRSEEPLILGGYGVHLSIDRDTLLIRDGLTHDQQDRAQHRFFKGDPNRPPRIVMLDGSGSLSFDVLTWLSEQGVPLFKINYQGNLVSVVAGRAAYDPERVMWQIKTRENQEARLNFASEIIHAKLTATLETLERAIPQSSAREVAIGAAHREINAIQAGAFASIDALRLSEARAASSYFQAWKPITIRWLERWRHLVPGDWRTLGSRRSMRAPFATNRNATHPVNAMLNYAYAALHSAVQTEAVARGYDPARGIMHETRSDASALVLDFMEPRRPVIDAAILHFIAVNKFSGKDFVIGNTGVCRLVPELAKRIAQLSPV